MRDYTDTLNAAYMRQCNSADAYQIARNFAGKPETHHFAVNWQLHAAEIAASARTLLFSKLNRA